jgi:hypothetical protein
MFGHITVLTIGGGAGLLVGLIVRPPKCSASEANTYILTSGLQLPRMQNEKNCSKTLQFGYRAEDVPLVPLVLESKEAVDREFDGSWSRRRKFCTGAGTGSE